VIDFGKLSRPAKTPAPLDPVEIFSKTPNVEGAPNDLWKGQAEAVSAWHKNRTASDTVIALNTGAGKSIVGILVAQSLVNEGVDHVVFACSTIDLVKQTARECRRIGIKYTERVQSNFSNDLFETEKAFCITTYQSLFAPIGPFKTKYKPKGIIFDDAHVAERLVRDCLTLTVDRSKHPALHQKLLEIIRPEFDALDKGDHLEFVLTEAGQHESTLCPPGTAHRCKAQIIQALKDADYRSHSDLFFPTVQLYEHIGLCAIFVSARSIEITPPFIPSGAFEFLGDGTRRIYLSATLDLATDFSRAFGRSVPARIEPDNDAGNGERLILLGSEFDKSVDSLSVANAIVSKHKILISVPSYASAERWKTIGTPPKTETFSDSLEAFRQAKDGAFVLVSRVDGIDLPQDTCRVMLVDGAPLAPSLMERVLFTRLNLSNLYSTKMAGRITQLLGRINRGRADFGAFVVFGRDITNWMKTERNTALLPSLIRKQVALGRSLQADTNPLKASDVAGIIGQVLAREEGWLKFYRSTIDSLEVSEDELKKVRDRERQMEKAAGAECRFMTLLWQNNRDQARKVLLDILDDTALADAKLAGWYSLWLGMSYEIEGDMETAVAHYKMSRSRLSSWLNVPTRHAADAEALGSGKKTLLQTQLLSTNRHGPQALGNFIGKMRKQIQTLKATAATAAQHEEAVRQIGELLGFQASRPDNELGTGPDALWLDDVENYAIAFELKTKKETPIVYNKNEVGQAHNHIQWLKDEELDCDGLVILGGAGACTSEATPSNEIFLADPNQFADRTAELVAKIEDTRGRTAIERWADLNDLGGQEEWQLKGWWRWLARQQLKALKKA
jgi:hypothetical protein